MTRVVAVAILMVALVGPAQQASCADRDMLVVRVHGFASYPSSAFLSLCSQVCMPCGFEEMKQEPSRPVRPADMRHLPRVRIENGTVGEILDNLVSGPMKGYAWRVTDGVIEMLPRDVMDRKKTSVLEKRIPAVDVEKVAVDAAAEQICEAAGVAQRPLFGDNQGAVPTYGTASLHLKNVTVREALNALVRNDGQSMWVVQGYPGNPHTIYVLSCRAPHPEGRTPGSTPQGTRQKTP